jgi:hypothetical protein
MLGDESGDYFLALANRVKDLWHLIFKGKWCPGEDSNFHDLTVTAT